MIGGIEGEIRQRHPDNTSLRLPVIAEHEFAAAEFPVPANTIQQRIDRNHCVLDLCCDCGVLKTGNVTI